MEYPTGFFSVFWEHDTCDFSCVLLKTEKRNLSLQILIIVTFHWALFPVKLEKKDTIFNEKYAPTLALK